MYVHLPSYFCSYVTGHYAIDHLDANKTKYWPTPAESPDLNPIEMLWHELKHHLRMSIKPTTKEELINGITKFWATVTPKKCARYINHIRKVIPIVVAREKRASGNKSPSQRRKAPFQRKARARDTNFVLAEFKVIARDR